MGADGSAPRAAHIVWDDAPWTPVAPGIERRVAHGDGLTVLRVAFSAGIVMPRHEHPYEQCTNVLSGRLSISVGPGPDAPAVQVGAGETLIVPGGVPHESRALTDVVALEVFVPARDDLPAE